MRTLFVYAFADSLLLRMKKVDDRSTQAVISTLVFNHDAEHSSSESLDDETGEPRRGEDAEPVQEGEGMVVAGEASEKAMGKRVEV